MYFDQSKFGGDPKNHEKLYFWSRDICAVKNPLDRDFRFKYDSIWWTVPAGAGVTGPAWQKERYLCIRYCELMCQEIIAQMIMEKGEAALKELSKTNGNLLLDKYLENQQVWMKMPKPDDKALNEKIWKDLWLGVVERYGEEMAEDRPQAKLDRDSTLYQQLAEQFGDVKFDGVTPSQGTTTVVASETPAAPAPQETAQTLAQEVTNA